MTMPPNPPGQPDNSYGQRPGGQPPYGQGQPHGQGPSSYGQHGQGYGGPGQPGPGYGPGQPGGQPPKKGGIPTWAWIVGGVVALLLLCGCGGLGIWAVTGDDDPTDTATSETEDPSEDPTEEEPTDEESEETTEPPTTTTTTTEPSTTSSTSPLPSYTSPSVPPTPAGSTPNTDSSRQLSADDLEAQIARGMSQYGHTKEDIYCQQAITLIKDRTATCTAPVPNSDRRSDVTATVAWANVTSTQLQYYLTFKQQF